MNEISIYENKDQKIWDDFCDSSPDSTIFHSIKYLETINDIKFKTILVKYKGSIKAGCVLINSYENDKEIINHNQIIYRSNFFQMSSIRGAKKLSVRHLLMTEIAKYIGKNYEKS